MWEQLPEEEQEALLEKYRDWDVDDNDWCEYHYAQTKEKAHAVGFVVEQCYWSGFWSQGDGACFTGVASNIPLLLTAAGYEHLAEAAEGTSLYLLHNDRYYHENSVTFDFSGWYANNPYDEDEDHFKHLLWAATNPGDEEWIAAADAVEDLLRDLMIELYRDLEAEYEYLTSDENVIEQLYHNDIIQERLDELAEEARAEEENEAEICAA